MSSGGQTPVTQQTQQSKDPWGPAQPALQEAITGAESMYRNNAGYSPWPNATQAPVNDIYNAGLGTLQAQYSHPLNINGTPGVNAARDLGLQQIQSRGLSPELQSLYQQAQGDQNPYLQNILDTNNRRIGDRVNSSVSGAGRYGSGAHTDIMSRALAESADPILAQDYTRRQDFMKQLAEGGLQRAGQWGQLMPSLDEARLAGAQGLANLGQFYQERSQKDIDDQIKLFNQGQSRDWENLARYNAIVGGAGGLGGSQFGTQTTPINQPSTLQKLFGGAAAGAGIGGSFGGAPGGAIGAGVGGLLGLL